MSRDVLDKNISKDLKRYLDSGQEFVAYREPDSDQIHVLGLQQSSFVKHGADCFVVQPFEPNKPLKVYQIIEERVYAKLPVANRLNAFSTWSFDQDTLTQFEDLVSNALARIKQRKLKKVVLHSQLSVPLKRSADEAALKLLLAPVNAYRYVLYTESFGLWMGATPELLIRTNKSHYATMALAGTRLFNELTTNPFSQKEVAEQQWVVKEIKERLAPLVATLSVSETEVARAGKLAHLKNDFSGQFLEEFTTLDVAKALHPTAAVCGYPKEKALEYIALFESFDRSIYAGYLGRISNQISSLYVNIRCGRLKNDRFTAYVGAGITEDSVPANEANEIQTKTSTLATIFE